MGIPWMVTALALVALACTDARALEHPERSDVYEDDGDVYPGWLCEACRDPADHPADFAAFAYNAYWGEEPWAFDSELGIPFRVYNLELQWVVIWFEDLLFDGISLLPNTLDVRIRLETGEIITITLVQGGPDLPVGDEVTTTYTPPCGCGDDGESDAEADGIEEDFSADDNEWDEPGYDGVVDIVDPDDNGEFPEWTVEL